MLDIWNEIIGSVDEQLPKFNDKLLVDFRKDKIARTELYIEELFIEAIKILDGKLKYVRYEVLRPEERVAYMCNDNIFKGKIEIQNSEWKLVRYVFEFDEMEYYLYVYIPYLTWRNSIKLSGTDYYPLLVTVEKGINRIKDGVIIKVLRTKMTAWRKETMSVLSTDKRINITELVITICAYYGVRGSRVKRTPLLVYILSYYGLENSLKLMGFKEDEFSFATSECEEKHHSYIKLKENVFIRVKRSIVNDNLKARFLASFMVVIGNIKEYSISDLTDNDTSFYKVVLGKYIAPANKERVHYFERAQDHLSSLETALDLSSAYQLKQVGIDVNDIKELLVEIFKKIDVWLSHYVPSDLYNKKIGVLDQMMAGFVKEINTRLFKIKRNKRVGIAHDTIAKLTKVRPTYITKISKSTMFRANPSIHNDNWLISIGIKRQRSVDSPELRSTQQKSKPPIELLKLHESQPIVESMLMIPSSSPCVTGTINPFLEITEDGAIEPPDYAHLTKGVI